ncbi:MAG TPA: hypothetical protein RMH99_15175 [Sandaracinaceae bacterium LLY-WYZ-13_1]|nr:hypothetical protein [Sandaracinaceae bacterium LLY-WYZ-13_1]
MRSYPRSIVSLGSLLFVAGCQGALITEGPAEEDAGVVVRLDGGGPPPGTDAGPPPPSTDAGPPPPAVDGGPSGTDAGPTDPCAGVSCGANAHCDPRDGACYCDEGFVDMGGACEAPPPGDPVGRTQAEVCDAWNAGHVENASPAWSPGAGTCDPGTLSPDAIDDTLRRVNMFRWLAGLGAVPHDGSRHDELMECARMMDVNGSLSHDPPMSWDCWTSGGASAAGRSNIALGYRTGAASIDGYMRDRNTMSLGHRRWILGARLGGVEIGSAGRGHCLGVFGSGGSTDRAWSAYPNQGFAPIETAQNTWSVQAYSISFTGGSDVEVVRLSDGVALPVEVYQTGGFGPPPTIGFVPMGWSGEAGETYRVTITDTSDGDITYETTLVSC